MHSLRHFELVTTIASDRRRTENTAGALPDRVTLYTQSNKEYAGDDMTNKPLGGGLVASALDLVRLGDGVLNGTILNQAQRTTMWTPPGGYGYGWNIRTAAGGQRTVGKDGAQRGANSYLRVYPDDGIVISVLSNRDGAQDPSTLSKQIGELMLAELP